MPSRSIRDQMQMRPQPVMGVRPTSPQPAARPGVNGNTIVNPRAGVQAPSTGTMRVGPLANAGQPASRGAVSPQLLGGHPPTMSTVAQGMNGINTQSMQPRVAMPVQQAPVGVAPAAAPVARPQIQPQIGRPR